MNSFACVCVRRQETGFEFSNRQQIAPSSEINIIFTSTCCCRWTNEIIQWSSQHFSYLLRFILLRWVCWFQMSRFNFSAIKSNSKDLQQPTPPNDDPNNKTQDEIPRESLSILLVWMNGSGWKDLLSGTETKADEMKTKQIFGSLESLTFGAPRKFLFLRDEFPLESRNLNNF